MSAVAKTKKDLIHKAKVKKQYAKVKAEAEEEKRARREGKEAAPASEADEDHHEIGDDSVGANGDAKDDGKEEPEGEVIHPTRQLMLKDEEAAQTGATADQAASDGQRRRTRRPGY